MVVHVGHGHGWHAARGCCCPACRRVPRRCPCDRCQDVHDAPPACTCATCRPPDMARIRVDILEVIVLEQQVARYGVGGDGVHRQGGGSPIMYSPPWCTRVDGELVELPTTPASFARAVRLWNRMHRGWGTFPWGGALVRARPPGQALVRRDSAVMAAWVAQHEGDLPRRERQVYELYYVRGLGLAACARAMGLTRGGARGVLRGLRRRATA